MQNQLKQIAKTKGKNIETLIYTLKEKKKTTQKVY